MFEKQEIKFRASTTMLEKLIKNLLNMDSLCLDMLRHFQVDSSIGSVFAVTFSLSYCPICLVIDERVVNNRYADALLIASNLLQYNVSIRKYEEKKHSRNIQFSIKFRTYIHAYIHLEKIKHTIFSFE